MKSSEFKERLEKVKPNEFQKQRILEQVLKPRSKLYKKLLFVAPVVFGIMVFSLIMPVPQEQMAQNSSKDDMSHIVADQVISFEYEGEFYISTGEVVSISSVGKYKGTIEVSDVFELGGCAVYESNLENHVIVKHNGEYELFRRGDKNEMDLGLFSTIIRGM